MEHTNYPHEAGYLIDCPACEQGPCQCADQPGRAPCVSIRCKRMVLDTEQIKSAFSVVLGFQARPADVGIVKAMGATPEVIANYIWDHWLGEPETVTADEIEKVIRKEVCR